MNFSDITPWVPCSECGAIVPYLPGAIEAHLTGTAVSCPQCTKPIDWWHAVLQGIDEHFYLGQVMAMAGCRSLAFSVDVPRDEAVEVDLINYGIPADAEVVHMNLTGTGNVMPVLLHGNHPIRDPIGGKFWLYGRPTKEPFGNGAGVNLLVTWFVRETNDTVLRHLVDAARHYHAQRFDALVVPAQIASESSLAPVMAEFFNRFGSSRNVEDMLENGATYSHQLNVLSNVTADVVGVPRLPDPIRGILNRLRRLRNKLAHEGSCEKQTKRDAVEHLAATLFSVRYSSVLGNRIAASAADTQPRRPMHTGPSRR